MGLESRQEFLAEQCSVIRLEVQLLPGPWPLFLKETVEPDPEAMFQF